VWLVEQFRYTIQERALELPQGGWEMEVENPEELARGELKEETGLEAAEMTTWEAVDRLRLHAAEAARLSGHRADRDREGSPTPRSTTWRALVSVAEFEEMMRNGTIRDGCTLAAWGLYLLALFHGNVGRGVGGRCTRRGADEAVVVQLLDDVGGPAGDAADGEDGRIEVDVDAQRGVGGGGVESPRWR
jgi:hypothetical protein